MYPLCRAEDRNLAIAGSGFATRLLSLLRLQPEFDESADGFGSARFIGFFCCPGIHIVAEFGRQSDGRYRVLTGCRTPPFFS
jgi:hypothetical protein